MFCCRIRDLGFDLQLYQKSIGVLSDDKKTIIKTSSLSLSLSYEGSNSLEVVKLNLFHLKVPCNPNTTQTLKNLTHNQTLEPSRTHSNAYLIQLLSLGPTLRMRHLSKRLNKLVISSVGKYMLENLKFKNIISNLAFQKTRRINLKKL